jgi:hypothetical protein
LATLTLTYSSSDLTAVLFCLINTRRRHSCLSHRPYCTSLKNCVSLFQGSFHEGKGGCSIRLIGIKCSFHEALSSCPVSYKLQLHYLFEISPLSRNHLLPSTRNSVSNHFPLASNTILTSGRNCRTIVLTIFVFTVKSLQVNNMTSCEWLTSCSACFTFWAHTTLWISVWVAVTGCPDSVVNRKFSISARNRTLISCPLSRRQFTVGYRTNCAGTLHDQGGIKHKTEK